MADPFSIVAVITGVVEVGEMVFDKTSHYVKAVKQGHKERSDLNEEVGALLGILTRLQQLSRAMEEKGDDEGCKPFLQAQQLYNCRKTLLAIKSKIDAYEGRGSATGRHALTSALKPLRWPFTSSEVGDLLVQIERHKANLSVALTADQLSSFLQALSTQDKICETVDGIKSELNRLALNDQRRQILDSFGSTDPSKDHDMSLKLWRPSTGLWFTEGTEFRDWLTDKAAKNLWCYGIPGSGKTVLASAVIEKVQERCSHSVAAAYYYCDYKDVKTQDPANILGSLVKQLILQSEQCFKESEEFYEVHHSGKQVSTSYRPDELRDLLLQMSSFFDQTMIVVGGLDECGKDTTIVVELLSSLSKSEISSVQTLFFSRDEIEIRETLTDYTPLSIAADKGDLQLYVAAELAIRTERRNIHINNPSIREHIMDRLVNGANGMFRWAVCQIDYLCELPDDRARCDALETLPPDLKSTYEQILRRVDKKHISVRRLVQRTLRWLVVARGDLTISALREALSMKEGVSRLDRDAAADEFVILHSCSSLVRKSVSGRELELAHFTVKEFLLDIDCDSGFSAYRVDVEESEVELGKVCLTYLTLQDFNSKVSWSREAQLERRQEYAFRFNSKVSWSREAQLKRRQEYAFRDYAIKNWLSHARGHLGDPDLLTLIQKLLDPSEPGTFTTWTHDHESIFGEEDRTVYAAVAATHKPLHYASAFALPKICKWLLDRGCKVDHMSRFGTPLNHAIGGPSSLVRFGGQGLHAFSERQKERRLKVIDILLEAGADPNSKSTTGKTPLFYALSDQDITLRLLKKGAKNNDERAHLGERPNRPLKLVLMYTELPNGTIKQEFDW